MQQLDDHGRMLRNLTRVGMKTMHFPFNKSNQIGGKFEVRENHVGTFVQN